MLENNIVDIAHIEFIKENIEAINKLLNKGYIIQGHSVKDERYLECLVLFHGMEKTVVTFDDGTKQVVHD